MRNLIYYLILIALLLNVEPSFGQKIFDTHIHGSKNPHEQLNKLKSAGIYKVAISTSWELQSTYESSEEIVILQGLMLACPDGKVPYSGQFCFPDKNDFPDIIWVENQLKENKIHFIGEVLGQYYGISPSDQLLYPYYALAEKYSVPVGIHTGLAGPGHGSPNFKVSLGSPILFEDLLLEFPDLKVWIMHAGAPFMDETIAIMTYYRNVYADISAISNPQIFPPNDFKQIMKRLVDAGLENRLMFGSDNGDIVKIVENVEALEFLTAEQKEKIFYKNAEQFFSKSAN